MLTRSVTAVVALRLCVLSAEVLLLDNCLVVYKVINDAIFYVVGGLHENELILQTVLQCLDETITNLLKSDKRQACT